MALKAIDQKLGPNVFGELHAIRQTLDNPRVGIDHLVNPESPKLLDHEDSTQKRIIDVKQEEALPSSSKNRKGVQVVEGIEIITCMPSKRVSMMHAHDYSDEYSSEDNDDDDTISTSSNTFLDLSEIQHVSPEYDESIGSCEGPRSLNPPRRIGALDRKRMARPAPIDLSYEDPITFQGGFNDKTIYPWSIDRQNHEQVDRMISMMTATVNSYILGGRTQL